MLQSAPQDPLDTPAEVLVAEADSNPAGQPAKKPRNKMERMVVRGGILLLLGAVAWQWYARDAYSRTVARFNKELAALEDNHRQAVDYMVTESRKRKLTRAEADKMVAERSAPFIRESQTLVWFSGFPSHTVEKSSPFHRNVERVDLFTWKGPFKSYVLHVHYDDTENPRLYSVDSDVRFDDAYVVEKYLQ